MAKTNSIRTEPVSLNESTLETNIVCEIASLFNSPFNFGYPFRLRCLFGFDRINLNAFRKRKIKLFRLTPTEENKGGGWDTKLSIPVGTNDSRAIFIQFKRGNHRDGNNINGSVFNYLKQNPNPHAEFSFNDNSNNNQHQTLKKLSDHLVAKGISSKAVMYGFPRITKLDTFDKLQEDLLLHTSFLTIPEIDAEAIKAKINLYDGKEHHFRTCYIKEEKREVSSETFQLTGKSENENILYEIILVKLARLKNDLYKIIPPLYNNNELFLMLAEYLKVNPTEIIDLGKNYPNSFKDEIKKYFLEMVNERKKNLNELFNSNDFEYNPFNWREKLFVRVVDYFNKNGEEYIDINSKIPSEYTFNLQNQNPIELDIELDNSVTLLVF